VDYRCPTLFYTPEAPGYEVRAFGFSKGHLSGQLLRSQLIVGVQKLNVLSPCLFQTTIPRGGRSSILPGQCMNKSRMLRF